MRKQDPGNRIIVRGGDGAARKVIRDLSAVFSFAVRRGVAPDNAVARASVRKTDNRRERYLTLEEVSRLGAAFNEVEAAGANPKGVAIGRLWALTGCRRDEIAGLKWSEVDFERGLLILDDSKTGTSVRPLGAAALALLESISRVPGTDYVFPAEVGNGYYQGMKRLWGRVVEKAGLAGVTPHTLRHTIGSTAVSSGEALALTGAILGHANPRSTAIYAHVQHHPSRRAADRVSKKIADALSGKPSRRGATRRAGQLGDFRNTRLQSAAVSRRRTIGALVSRPRPSQDRPARYVRLNEQLSLTLPSATCSTNAVARRRECSATALSAHLGVNSEEDGNSAVTAALDRFGKLDVLINNRFVFSGRTSKQPVSPSGDGSAGNLTGMFLGTKPCPAARRCCGNAARETAHGSVTVNLASTADLVGSRQDPLYSMTKDGGEPLYQERDKTMPTLRPAWFRSETASTAQPR